MNIFTYAVSVVLGLAVLLGIVIVAIFIGAVFYERAKQLLRGPKGIDVGKGLEKIQIGFSKYYHLMLLIASYLIIVIFFSKSFPKIWEIYKSSSIFWWSQAGIILSFWLWALKGYYRWVAVMIWVLFFATYYINRPKLPEGDNTAKTARQSVAAAAAAVTDVKSVKVTAPVGRWSKRITIPCGYDWAWRKNSSYGLHNVRSLVKARINGNLIKEESMTNDGRIQEVYCPPSIPVYHIEFQSSEKYPVYIIFDFVERM